MTTAREQTERALRERFAVDPDRAKVIVTAPYDQVAEVASEVWAPIVREALGELRVAQEHAMAPSYYDSAITSLEEALGS